MEDLAKKEARPAGASIVERVLRAAQRLDRLQREIPEATRELQTAIRSMLSLSVPEFEKAVYTRVQAICRRCGLYERGMTINDARQLERKPECPCCGGTEVSVSQIAMTGSATAWHLIAPAPRACKVDGCQEPITSRDLCKRHYNQEAYRQKKEGSDR